MDVVPLGQMQMRSPSFQLVLIKFRDWIHWVALKGEILLQLAGMSFPGVWCRCTLRVPTLNPAISSKVQVENIETSVDGHEAVTKWAEGQQISTLRCQSEERGWNSGANRFCNNFCFHLFPGLILRILCKPACV
eukprot:3548565-Rhodomonas_salina.2